MPNVIAGKMDGSPYRFGMVVARFNDFITSRLVDGAMDALVRHGVNPDKITQVYVPGSFEIPLAARKLAESGRCDAVITLGCLIRGQTPHFDYIAAEATKGIAAASLATGVPITYGVITAETLEQAIDRAGAKAGNKGVDAALAAIEMAGVIAGLGKS
jgi:6,7-dimethyl-8-ribityllumazine synthase